ncbi:MAG: hypothetical protein ABSD72_04025 [Terracidiphilus sp.]
MKKIGIVGGVGWRSTVDYYSETCRRGEELCSAANQQGFRSTPDLHRIAGPEQGFLIHRRIGSTA